MVGKKTRIGLSIYSDFYPDEKSIIEKLEFVHKLGYTDVFTSLQLSELGFANTKPGLSNKTKSFLNKSCELGISVHADINREVLDTLKAKVDDLTSIAEANIPILRLDAGFSSAQIALMTKNPYGIMIEDNLCSYDNALRNKNEVLQNGNPNQYSGCHNFYPHNDTGLPIRKAVEIAKDFHEAHLQTGIFIGSESSPNDLCSVGHSVPTIESHRWIPSVIQMESLLCTEAFDFIIFGDSMPSNEELIQISKCDCKVSEVISSTQADYYRNELSASCLETRVIDIPVYWDSKVSSSISALESMVFLNRMDYPDKVIRMTCSRNLFNFKPFNLVNRHRGAITIDNELSGHYTGELQISLVDLPAAVNTNLIGMIKPYGIELLDLVRDGKVAFRLNSKI